MSNDKRKNTKKSGNESNKVNRFLARLPSNLPFAPLVRRPNYQLRRISLKIRRTVSAGLVIAMVLLGVFFVYIGGFYYLTNENNSAFYTDPVTGESSPIYHGPNPYNHQTTLEGVTAGILMFTGAGGIYLMHKSTQFAYSPSTATKYLLAGIALVTFALASTMLIFLTKLDLAPSLTAPDQNSPWVNY